MGWRVTLCALGNARGVACRLSFFMRTILIGLGNPILGDDGVGWKVAEDVKTRLDSRIASLSKVESIDIEFLSLGGLSLMEHLIGYERAILIDAVSSDHETGSVIVSQLGEMPDYSAFHITSAHDTSLQNALKLGRAMGANLPEDVIVIGIATKHVYHFSEEISPSMAEAIPKAVQIVMGLLA
jgi:hydrogenase maturation protease